MVARTKFQVVAEETKYKYPVISIALPPPAPHFVCITMSHLIPWFPTLPKPSFSTSLPVPFFHCKPRFCCNTIFFLKNLPRKLLHFFPSPKANGGLIFSRQVQTQSMEHETWIPPPIQSHIHNNMKQLHKKYSAFFDSPHYIHSGILCCCTYVQI